MSKARQHDVGAFLAVRRGVSGSLDAGNDDGPVVDRQGFYSCVIGVATGEASGAPDTQSVIAKLQHGDDADGGDMADFTGGASDAVTTDDGVAQKNINLADAKRYVRVRTVTAFSGGSTPEVPVAALLVLGGADENPAT